MPSFPHTLISLGPFANQQCKIIFTKMAVSVTHPDGHSILEGWHEMEGPKLWRFPMLYDKPDGHWIGAENAAGKTKTQDEPGQCRSSANFLLWFHPGQQSEKLQPPECGNIFPLPNNPGNIFPLPNSPGNIFSVAKQPWPHIFAAKTQPWL